MDTVFNLIKLCLLFFSMLAFPGALAQDDMSMPMADMDMNMMDMDMYKTDMDAGTGDTMVQIPALSYIDDEGMLAIPSVNLSNAISVLALQELIGNQSCDCTSSGYSGVNVSNDGTLESYGNTTFVGCKAHSNDELGSEDQPASVCYVVGGTGCDEATPSKLEGEVFTMAAWRGCNPLASKSFGPYSYGGGYSSGSSSSFKQTIEFKTQAYNSYKPPVCSYCNYKPPKTYNTGYGGCYSCGGYKPSYGGASAAASSYGGASAAASTGFGGASAAASSFGG